MLVQLYPPQPAPYLDALKRQLRRCEAPISMIGGGQGRLPAREVRAQLVQQGTRRSPSAALLLANGSRIDLKTRRSSLPAGAPETIYAIDVEAFVAGANDAAEARWLSPVANRPDRMPPDAAQNSRDAALASWEGRFSFKEERRSGDQVVTTGLRPPQVGALYGILAHWKTSTAPATVVMPTGTGKTETMLALLTREVLGRLLVIVPTNYLREQIGEKFVTLGLLKTLASWKPKRPFQWSASSFVSRRRETRWMGSLIVAT